MISTEASTIAKSVMSKGIDDPSTDDESDGGADSDDDIADLMHRARAKA